MRIKPKNFAFLSSKKKSISDNFLALHKQTNTLALSSFLGQSALASRQKSNINKLYSTSLKQRLQNKGPKLPEQLS